MLPPGKIHNYRHTNLLEGAGFIMYYIGIDLGGTNIKAGLVASDGRILSKGNLKTRADRPYQEICADMAALAKEVADRAGVKMSDVAGIGVGSPGMIDSANGVVTYANNLNWRKVPVAAEIHRHTSVNVKVSNDANVAALGEALFGGGKGYDDSILITLGTGVGSGIIIGKKIVEGNKSAGGEAGHMVIRTGGIKCTCGRRGCFEAYASATALVRMTKEAMLKNKDSEMWQVSSGNIEFAGGQTAFLAEERGDKAATAVLKKYINYLGEGIINLINTLRPQAVILGGGVCAAGERLLEPLRKQIKKYSYGGKYGPETQLNTATLGNDAGLVGAAALWMD